MLILVLVLECCLLFSLR